MLALPQQYALTTSGRVQRSTEREDHAPVIQNGLDLHFSLAGTVVVADVGHSNSACYQLL